MIVVHSRKGTSQGMLRGIQLGLITRFVHHGNPTTINTTSVTNHRCIFFAKGQWLESILYSRGWWYQHHGCRRSKTGIVHGGIHRWISRTRCNGSITGKRGIRHEDLGKAWCQSHRSIAGWNHRTQGTSTRMSTFAVMAPKPATNSTTGNVAGCVHTRTHVLK